MDLERLAESDRGVAAGYYLHSLIIELRAETQLIARDGENIATDVSAETIAAFLHEYLHFLHNFSTVSGFYSLETWHTIIALVSGCVGDTGEVDAGKLKPAAAAKIGEMLERDDRLFGDFQPRWFAKASVVGIDGLDDDTVPVVVRLEVEDDDGNASSHAVRLGLGAVLEGVAHECEQLCRAQLGVEPKSAPAIPYLCLQMLTEYVIGPSQSQLGLLCGLAALQCLDPGRGLLRALRFAKKAAGGDHEDDHIASALIKSFLSDEVLTPIISDLQSMRDQYDGRGIAGTGMKQLADLVLSLMTKRLADPIFEVRELLDRESTINILQTVHPCAVLQHHKRDADKGGPKSPTAVLSAFGVGDVAGDAGPRALQSIVHFIFAHLDGTSLVSSVNAAPDPCPFFHCCELPRRRNMADSCKRRPWVSMQDNPTCWYGSALWAMRGKVSSRVVTAEDDQ